METTSRQTQCPVSKILQRYIKEQTYSALSFDRINFFNIANLFLLSRKVNASFHISNRPWIPCDAYTK